MGIGSVEKQGITLRDYALEWGSLVEEMQEDGLPILPSLGTDGTGPFFGNICFLGETACRPLRWLKRI
ncbi:MAG: hypothetical protein A4E45_00824 [Methanosaeta sp. PtaB.Bin039]|nr:MAG: hypothetical protein A4E45_00824 [Methanosaeta sp. PtaB.Bin039]OPY45288.1 MAG: hypothetical protein A4E47_01030 [Methanosaeta sp. PtaU1.Bin028]